VADAVVNECVVILALDLSAIKDWWS